MLFARKKMHFFLFVVGIAVASSFVCAQETVAPVTPASIPASNHETTMPTTPLSALFDTSGAALDKGQLEQVIRNIFYDFQRKMQEQRQQLLGLLPEASQKLIAQVQAIYEEFLEQVSIGNGLLKECVLLQKFSQEIKQEHPTLAPKIDELAPLLEKVHKSLLEGSFGRLLGNGENGQLMMMLNPLQFGHGALKTTAKDALPGAVELEDLKKILLCLQDLKKEEAFATVSVACSSYSFLAAMFEAIIQQDVAKITHLYLQYLEPLFAKTSDKLNQACSVLEQRHVELTMGDDVAPEHKELARAYVLWLRELRGYLRTIVVFSSLKDGATSLASGTQSIFTAILYSFDVYKNFFDLYVDDHNLGLFDTSAPSIFNYALRTGIATWHFFLKRSEFSTGVLFNVVQGNAALSTLDPMQVTMFNMMLSSCAVFVFANPGFWHKRIHGSIRELGKIVSAWIYYQIFYEHLFDRDGKWWPTKSPHVRQALLHGLNELSAYVFTHLHSYVRMYGNPELVEKVENYSVGIIKPELLGYLFDTFLPLILLSGNELIDKTNHNKWIEKIVHCERSNCGYNGWFFDRVWDNYEKQFLFKDGKIDFNADEEIKKALALMTPALQKDINEKYAKDETIMALKERLHKDPTPEAIENEKAKEFQELLPVVCRNYLHEHSNAYCGGYAEKINIEVYYVECRLIHYLFSSVGRHLGKTLTNHYKDALASGVCWVGGKMASGLVTVGLMSQNTADLMGEAKDEFTEGMESVTEVLQAFLREVFTPGSPVRSLVIPLLEQMGKIDHEDGKDSLFLNQELLDVCLHQLAEKELISYLDARKIEQKFSGSPEEIDATIALVLDKVRANLAGMMGGWVGAGLGGVAGSLVMSGGPYFSNSENVAMKK